VKWQKTKPFSKEVKMTVHLITGYAGEAHIASEDAGSYNAGVCGLGKYVMLTGSKMAATILSSSTIRLADGDAVDQGRHIKIPAGEYEDVTIAAGNQGRTRIDVIAIKYSVNESTNVEKAEIAVVQGTETDIGQTPTVPSCTDESILDGASVDFMPLYHVLLENAQIASVTKVFEVMATLSQVWPVGSIYETTQPGNPSELFGGTWREIGGGKVLVGRGTGYEAGATGGNKEIELEVEQLPAHTHVTPSHAHTATTSSDGAHTHTVPRTKNAGSGSSRYAAQAGTSHNSGSAGAHTHTVTVKGSGDLTTNATGAGEAVNIEQPYLVVYRWERIA